MSDADGRWRDGVRVVRAGAVAAGMRDPASGGRSTVFDFAGSGGCSTWIGSVALPPRAATGLHHHGRHEVAVYVVQGRSEIRWGELLEFAAEIGPGDFVYFGPGVPHQERNPDDNAPVVFLVVRSDNERIVVRLDSVPVDRPDFVC